MNPLIRKKGICDPHIHIYEGKAYLYATHDVLGYEEGFCMEDWHIYSSEDFIEWKLERIVRPEEFYCGALNQCWAVDAAWRNGRYYWYFSTGSWGVGVGVSDRPAGPFRDVLGKPLIDYSTYPVGVPKWDPCVFIDDDGEAYLIVGECREPAPWDCYLIAKLNEDMISLAEPMRRIEYIENPNKEDKPSIHKYNGKYYLTHSSFYAVADNVYGPYYYVGNTGCNIDHGSFFLYHNQTYFASGGMDNPDMYIRASFLAPCHYRENGEIVIDQKIMEYGCGQYDAAWERIEAEWYFDASRECKKELKDGGFAVALKRGECVGFPNIANVEMNTGMQICAYTPENEAVIEIREGSAEGTVLGKCIIQKGKESEKFEIIPFQLNCTGGKKTLYLKTDAEVVIDWFAFKNGKHRYTIEPSYAEFQCGGALDYDSYASMNRVLHNLELRGSYMQGIADGGKGGIGELVIPYYCADEPVKLKLYVNGIYQKDLLFPVTGKRKLEKSPRQLRTQILVKPGINVIKVVSDFGFQEGNLAINNIVLETEESPCKVYAAANGIVEPKGNGCWDHLPQRECDTYAFSGRAVKYLKSPGDSVEIQSVDGGDGGAYILEIRYARAEKGRSDFELEINGIVQTQIEFEETGTWNMRKANVSRVQILLQAGQTNSICLRKIGAGDQGITVDAFAVVVESEHN